MIFYDKTPIVILELKPAQPANGLMTLKFVPDFLFGCSVVLRPQFMERYSQTKSSNCHLMREDFVGMF
jgi:hypothetical protein